ncbi:MAG: alpha/beta hydrolase-fold protein [Candidatus Xenobia bacterium]
MSEALANWRVGEIESPVLDPHGVTLVFPDDDPGEVFVAGSFNDWKDGPHRMEWRDGQHVLRLPLTRDVEHEYKFVRNGHWFRDPHNPWVAWDRIDRHGVGQFNSVITPLGRPDHARLFCIRFRSALLRDEREVYVMVPNGWEPGRELLPVLYVNDGNESITRGAMHWQAEEAMWQRQCRRLILVFVGLPDQNVRGAQYVSLPQRRLYAQFLAHELVPYIERHFATTTDRGIIGASYGGANAFYVAFQHPEVFGKAAAQSGSFFVNNLELVKWARYGRRLPLQLYHDASRPGPQGGRGDMSQLGRAMADALAASGYHYHYNEVEGHWHDWSCWAERFPAALASLFPPQ